MKIFVARQLTGVAIACAVLAACAHSAQTETPVPAAAPVRAIVKLRATMPLAVAADELSRATSCSFRNAESITPLMFSVLVHSKDQDGAQRCLDRARAHSDVEYIQLDRQMQLQGGNK